MTHSASFVGWCARNGFVTGHPRGKIPPVAGHCRRTVARNRTKVHIFSACPPAAALRPGPPCRRAGAALRPRPQAQRKLNRYSRTITDSGMPMIHKRMPRICLSFARSTVDCRANAGCGGQVPRPRARWLRATGGAHVQGPRRAAVRPAPAGRWNPAPGRRLGQAAAWRHLPCGLATHCSIRA